MIATLRRHAALVSTAVLLFLPVAPDIVRAAPPSIVPPASMSAPIPDALAALKGAPATLESSAGRDRPDDRAPAWLDTQATQASSGGWWSRRTTAQKTWFVIGLVVAGAGIAYAAGNHSSSHSGSGGGGGGGGY